MIHSTWIFRTFGIPLAFSTSTGSGCSFPFVTVGITRSLDQHGACDINDSHIVKPWSAKTRYPGRRFLKMPVSVLTKIYLIICFARCYTKAKSNLGKIFAQNCCQNLGNAILEILISKLFPGECPGIPYKCGPTRCLTKV